MTLDEAKCGCKYCIKSVNGENCERLRMMSLGIVPGHEVHCCNNQWEGLIIRCLGCKIAMRNEEAATIEIDPVD